MWRGVTWCDVCDVMWYDVMWCDVCDVTYVMWRMWCDVLWCVVMCCDMMWYDVMWGDVTWCDVIAWSIAGPYNYLSFSFSRPNYYADYWDSATIINWCSTKNNASGFRTEGKKISWENTPANPSFSTSLILILVWPGHDSWENSHTNSRFSTLINSHPRLTRTW